MGEIFKDNIKIEELKLSVRLYNCLKNTNIKTLDDLMTLEEDSLIRIRNLGKKSLEELNELRKSVNYGVIPLKEVSYKKNKEFDKHNIKLIDLFREEEREIENIMFYDSHRGYVDYLFIKDLNLSVRSYNALSNSGIDSTLELLDINLIDFNTIKNLGSKSKEEILNKVKETIRIKYKVKDSERGNERDLEKIANWIVEDFEKSKIEIDTNNLKARIIERLRELVKSDINKIFLENILDKENIYKIYDDKFFTSVFKSKIINDIEQKGHGTTLKNIIDLFPSHIKQTDFVINLVDNMILDNIIETYEDKYRVYYPVLEEVISNLSDDREKIIIENRLLGRTLEEIGSEIGITRERVRQKEGKILKKMPRVREDDYRYVFEKYDWSKEGFIYVYNVDIKIYSYLNTKYKKGSIELKEALTDNGICVKIRQRIENFVYKDYLLIGNVRIKKEKHELLDYVLKTFCKEDISVEDLNDIYRMFLEDYNLDKGEYKFLDRYFETNLSYSNQVLWKFKKRLRYFDFSDFDSEKIISSLGLENYKNIEISTLKIFRDCNHVMKEWGIRDEYELHNLMKKVIGDKNNIGIKFLRMPNVEFGNADRDMQVLELLIQSAPITNYDLAKLYDKEYGVKSETVLANYFKVIEEYYHEGMYSIDYKCLDKSELKEMKAILSDDIYLLREVKDLYKRHFPQGDSTTINPYSLRCMGFKVTSLFIYSDKFSSIDDYFRQVVLNNEVFNATGLMKRFANYQSFYNVIYSMKNNYEILEFEPNVFISIKRLQRKGITKKDLFNFINSVDSFIGQEIFTIKSLRKRGFEHYLDDLGFDDWFYSSILRCNSKYKSRRVEENIILKNCNYPITLNDLIEYVVTKYRKMDIFDLIDYVYDEYGVKISKGNIYSVASERELYYDAIMEKLYIDYDEYFEEV